jgi:hypothetical protein
MTANEERDLQAELAPVGLPDDLPEVALTGEPAPDAAALGRIKQRALARVAAVVPEDVRVEAARRRPRRWAWNLAAAVALLALTTTVVVGPDQVRAYVGRFIPGLGLADQTGVRLAAAAPVRAVQDNQRVEVLGLVLDEHGGWLSLVSEYVPLTDQNVWLEDTAGHRTQLKSSGRSWSSRSYHGWYRVPKSVRAPDSRLTVVVEDAASWRLDVPLVPGDQLPSLDQFGPSASLLGYTLTARAIDLGDRTGVDVLVQRAPEGARVQGIHALALQAPGWTSDLSAKSAPITELWQYDADPLPSGATSVTLTIPALEVHEFAQGSVKLHVATGPVDKVVQMGQRSVRITRTEVTDEGLAVFVEPSPGLAAWVALQVDGEGTGWMHRRSEQTGLIESFVVPVPAGARTVALTMVQPEVFLQGPWIIDIPVTR